MTDPTIASWSLGIDLGTTSVKTLLLDRAGAVVAVASEHHGIDPDSLGVQADPEVWWSSLRRALTRLAVDADLSRVAAVGFSGNMSAVVLVDEEDRALVPAMLLADQRGSQELQRLDGRLRKHMVEATGNEPGTVFSLSSLLWYRNHDPERLARSAAFLSAKDFLRARLTGRFATDATDAYNSLVLTDDGEWDGVLIGDLGLPPEIFPDVLNSAESAGTVTSAASAQTGLKPGIPVATGAGDVAAAMLGLGELASHELAISLGTSATLMAPLADGGVLPRSAAGAVTRHPSADGGWFALGSLLTGGLVINWLREVVGVEQISAASDLPDPNDPLLFLPYLAGTGSPDFDSTATGTVLGITPSTSPAALVSSGLEAVAFDLADLVERLEADHPGKYTALRASGGGTRISAWPQIIADVVGRPVRLVEQSDLSAVGAAILGWSALGEHVMPDQSERTVHPRPEHAAAWRVRRERYERARLVLVPLTHDLNLTSTQKEATS